MNVGEDEEEEADWEVVRAALVAFRKKAGRPLKSNSMTLSGRISLELNNSISRLKK